MALIANSDVKTFLGIPSAETTDDTVLTNATTRAQAIAQEFCDRAFEAANFTEYYDGKGDDILFLKQMPLVSITSIHDDIERVFGASTALTVADMVLYEKEGFIKYLDGYFTKGSKNIKIVYRAGYGSGTGETAVPADLTQAIIYLAAAIYLEGKAGVNVAENQEIVYRPEYLKKQAFKILDKYKRVTV